MHHAKRLTSLTMFGEACYLMLCSEDTFSSVPPVTSVVLKMGIGIAVQVCLIKPFRGQKHVRRATRFRTRFPSLETRPAAVRNTREGYRAGFREGKKRVALHTFVAL